jgi:hypothetical protein
LTPPFVLNGFVLLIAHQSRQYTPCTAMEVHCISLTCNGVAISSRFLRVCIGPVNSKRDNESCIFLSVARQSMSRSSHSYSIYTFVLLHPHSTFSLARVLQN